MDVATIPIGAREITIRETSLSAVIGSYNTYRNHIIYYCKYIVLFVALQLGSTNILNGDFELFTPGSYMVAADGLDFLYNISSSSGVDVAFIDGPLSEQLLIRVSHDH